METPGVIAEKARIVDAFIERYFADASEPSEEIAGLLKSMRYSAMNGGKRFRPVLSLLTGELLKQPQDGILPFALALEFVHTYSLIHDDLPCMDDDDERRGQPTNHKVFGEDIALIAGDALLTEAFYILADGYDADLSKSLTKLLSRAAGFRGMVGGQAIDLKAQKDGIEEVKLVLMHRLKTGALIEAAVTGAALTARADADTRARLSEFGALLGLAFQVADDILDYQSEGPEKGNFATVKGLEPTREYLRELTARAERCLIPWGDAAESLLQILRFNARRTV